MGTAGVGLFKDKVTYDLRFKKINAGSTKVTVTDDTVNNEVDINIAETNIALQNLGGVLPYAKTNLSSSIINADISPAAAIAYSKLNLANTIGNADIAEGAGITKSKLVLSDQITNAEINTSAGITYSKLNLTNSIVNADINSAAAIPYAKLNLAGTILNADLNAAIAIDWSKVSKTGSHLDDLADVTIDTPSAGDVPTWTGTQWVNLAPPGASAGEANTISNIGTTGIGIWKQKVGINHELKKLAAASVKITVIDNTTNNTVDLNVAATVAATDQANTFGAFAQTFKSSTIKMRNPADTFETTFVNGVQTGNFNLTIPPLTANDTIATVGLPNTFTQIQTVDKTAETGIAEGLQGWYVSDAPHADGYIEFSNINAAAAGFTPRISLKANTAAAARLQLYCSAANDTGGAPLFTFDFAREGDADVTTRPLFSIRNNLLNRLTVTAAGQFSFMDGANFALGGTLGTKIGTGTTQKIGFFNATPVVRPAAIATPAATSADLKIAVDAIRTTLIALGLTG